MGPLIALFIAFLAAQGIYCAGYTYESDSDLWPPKAIVLKFAPEVTQEQKDQAYALVSTWQPPAPKAAVDVAEVATKQDDLLARIEALEAKIAALEAK